MQFSLDRFLQDRPQAVATNLDAVFGDPAREGALPEMPCNLPDAVIAAIKQSLDEVQFNRYPTSETRDLRAQIAEWLELPATHTALFENGAFAAIDRVMQWTGRGARVLTLDPDFFMYRLAARKYGLDVRVHDLAADFSLDLDGLLLRIADFKPDLIVLSNPHNPTSAWFPPQDIAAVLEHAPGLVLIDEVYAAFSPDPAACCALLGRYPNLLILRSFSKIGAATIRFGFLLGDERVLDQIGAAQTTFAISGVTLKIAATVIRHYPLIDENVQAVIGERDRMVRRLEALPAITIYRSGTNFVVVRFKTRDASSVCRSLAAQDVRVIPYEGAAALNNCLRFSVDTPANNRLAVERLCAALSG